jgi:hypothetical protein
MNFIKFLKNNDSQSDINVSRKRSIDILVDDGDNNDIEILNTNRNTNNNCIKNNDNNDNNMINISNDHKSKNDDKIVNGDFDNNIIKNTNDSTKPDTQTSTIANNPSNSKFFKKKSIAVVNISNESNISDEKNNGNIHNNCDIKNNEDHDCDGDENHTTDMTLSDSIDINKDDEYNVKPQKAEIRNSSGSSSIFNKFSFNDNHDTSTLNVSSDILCLDSNATIITATVVEDTSICVSENNTNNSYVNENVLIVKDENNHKNYDNKKSKTRKIVTNEKAIFQRCVITYICVCKYTWMHVCIYVCKYV